MESRRLISRLKTKSLLGIALTDLKKYDEAESLLLDGYMGMKDNPEADETRKRQALEGLIQLYEDWGKPNLAAELRAQIPDESKD